MVCISVVEAMERYYKEHLEEFVRKHPEEYVLIGCDAKDHKIYETMEDLYDNNPELRSGTGRLFFTTRPLIMRIPKTYVDPDSQRKPASDLELRGILELLGIGM